MILAQVNSTTEALLATTLGTALATLVTAGVGVLWARAAKMNSEAAKMNSEAAKTNSEAAKIQAEAAAISAETAKNLGQENKAKLVEVGKQFDGRLTQLLAETEKAQRALGVTEGQDKERGVQRDDQETATNQAKALVELAALKATEILKDAADVARCRYEHEIAEKKEAEQAKEEVAVKPNVDIVAEKVTVSQAEVRRADEHHP